MSVGWTSSVVWCSSDGGRTAELLSAIVVVGRQSAGAVPWKNLSLSKCATNGVLFWDFCRCLTAAARRRLGIVQCRSSATWGTSVGISAPAAGNNTKPTFQAGSRDHVCRSTVYVETRPPADTLEQMRICLVSSAVVVRRSRRYSHSVPGLLAVVLR